MVDVEWCLHRYGLDAIRAFFREAPHPELFEPCASGGLPSTKPIVSHDLYLAGGVGVALHLGHRSSFDLGFFSRSFSLDLDRVQAADELGFYVASLRDLAVMKLAAIATRGLRRDYWELHTILTSIGFFRAG